MNPGERRFGVVDRTGTPLGFTCLAKSPSAAAKKAFYVSLRKQPSERVVSIRRASEDSAIAVPREDDVKALVAELVGNGELHEGLTERYLNAARACVNQTAVIHIAEDSKPRIWSYNVHRAPRWPFNRHQIMKGIYTSTFAKRLR